MAYKHSALSDIAFTVSALSTEITERGQLIEKERFIKL